MLVKGATGVNDASGSSAVWLTQQIILMYLSLDAFYPILQTGIHAQLSRHVIFCGCRVTVYSKPLSTLFRVEIPRASQWTWGWYLIRVLSIFLTSLCRDVISVFFFLCTKQCIKGMTLKLWGQRNFCWNLEGRSKNFSSVETNIPQNSVVTFLIYWGRLVAHICVTELSHHWFI